MTLKLRYIFIVVSLLFIPTLAMAFRMGDIEVTPSLSMGGKYDSNISQTHLDPQGDFITRLTGALDLALEKKQELMHLTGSLSHEMYATNSGRDNTSESLTATYQRQIDRNSRFDVKDTFDHTQEPTTFADAFGRTSGTYSYYLNRLNLGYTHEFTRQFSLTTGYNNEIYDPQRTDLAASMKNALSLRSDYILTSTVALFGVYGFSRRTFDPGSHVTAHNWDAGIRRFFSAKTYLDLIAGLSALTAGDGSKSTKPHYEASLNHEISGKTKAQISLSQQSDTTYSNSDLFKSWRATASLIHRLYNRLTGSAELFHGQGQYTSLKVKDDFNGASARMIYELTPTAGVFIGYTYSKTDSNFATRSYSRNIISAGVKIKF